MTAPHRHDAVPRARPAGTAPAVRLAVGAVALLGLLPVVALASRARVPAAPGAGPALSATAADVLSWLFAGALLAGLVVAALVVSRGGGRQQQRAPRRGLRSTLVLVAVVALAAWLVPRYLEWRGADDEPVDDEAAEEVRSDDAPVGERGSRWPLGLAVAAAVLAAGASRVAAAWRADDGPDDAGASAAPVVAPPAGAVDLEALAAIADPRAAVIACYGAAQALLARAGTPPLRTEVPREYARRVGDRPPGAGPPLRRLTSQYEWARFSGRPVGQARRDAALAAVDELAAAVDGAIRAPS